MDTLFCSEESTKLAPPLKVSELVALLKNDVERSHRNIRVVGEIASFKQWQSGHCYFDIKDEKALIPAVMFRPHFLRVPFKISDGLEILFVGRVSVYAANARLQMIVEGMEPLGQGALALAFLQLKEKLQARGMFDLASKKVIKKLNNTIGIVTSSQGAALRDMVRIIKGRCPGANILLASARVQGQGAKEEIAASIKTLDQDGACDVIIVGRGGGSLEDLWAFNEEIVAQAIFEARTPIISAVGHETDTTISDFVADMRAATPTHAAILATPVVAELHESLNKILKALYDRQIMAIKNRSLRLLEQKKRIKDPRVLLFRYWQSLDELLKRINEHITRRLKTQKTLLNFERQRIIGLAPFRRIALKREALFDAKTRMNAVASLIISTRRKIFEQQVVKLEALSPLGVLARGYAILRLEQSGQVISSPSQVKINDPVVIRLHQGLLKALITNKENL